MVRFFVVGYFHRSSDTMFNALCMLPRNSCTVFAPQVQTLEEDVPRSVAGRPVPQPSAYTYPCAQDNLGLSSAH